jgi:cellulose synthase/poly-beta-1,6-N-acetylglucosamine synthase-like glycosyltransferase
MALLDHEDPGLSGRTRHSRGAQRVRPAAARSVHQTRFAPELDCLIGLCDPAVLRAAEHRGRVLGIGADRVLINDGVLTERMYVARLARGTGLRFNPLEPDSAVCLLAPDRIGDAAASGIIPIRRGGRLIYVVAPRRCGARGLALLAAGQREVASHLELTTTAALNRFLQSHYGGALADQAVHGLRRLQPALSAAPADPQHRWQRVWQTVRIAGVAAAIALAPLVADGVWSSMLALFFLGFVALRVIGSLTPARRPVRQPRRADRDLPVYSIVIALYREASSVAPLIRAIGALDYPQEKLDVIIVTETDDPATREAIARLGAIPYLQVLTVPDRAPRTKPKALNYALPFVRGSFIAVFDAEDRPEPAQLRAALGAFGNDGRVACAQAALCIDNGSESLLSRMFAAEYAAQFDLFLPGLTAMRLPLPLGGSSNHFRTGILRTVGGWDAHNVTEDADLGIRLARFGYRSASFASTTFEEAPVQAMAWLRQRTRWMKGWMQTWSVHMADPRQLWRDAGPRAFITINLLVGGNVLTALAYPTLVGELLAFLIARGVSGQWSGLLADRFMPLHIAAIAGGYLSTIALGFAGLARRRQPGHGWILLLAPVYWGLLSIAAWRALWQLWRDPTRWEKTEHGVSRRTAAVRLTDSA